jgi:hypothetical protein
MLNKSTEIWLNNYHSQQIGIKERHTGLLLLVILFQRVFFSNSYNYALKLTLLQKGKFDYKSKDSSIPGHAGFLRAIQY